MMHVKDMARMTWKNTWWREAFPNTRNSGLSCNTLRVHFFELGANFIVIFSWDSLIAKDAWLQYSPKAVVKLVLTAKREKKEKES